MAGGGSVCFLGTKSVLCRATEALRVVFILCIVPPQCLQPLQSFLVLWQEQAAGAEDTEETWPVLLLSLPPGSGAIGFFLTLLS